MNNVFLFLKEVSLDKFRTYFEISQAIKKKFPEIDLRETLGTSLSKFLETNRNFWIFEDLNSLYSRSVRLQKHVQTYSKDIQSKVSLKNIKDRMYSLLKMKKKKNMEIV